MPNYIDLQSLVCNGGQRNACGRRHLPEVDKSSPTSFIKTVNFDPKVTDHWYCGVDQSTVNINMNRFTFLGSYYNVYVKLAACDPPKGRLLRQRLALVALLYRLDRCSTSRHFMNCSLWHGDFSYIMTCASRYTEKVSK